VRRRLTACPSAGGKNAAQQARPCSLFKVPSFANHSAAQTACDQFAFASAIQKPTSTNLPPRSRQHHKHPSLTTTPTAQRWRQRHGGAVQPPQQAKNFWPTNHHGKPTAKPCPLHARLGEAHRLNKHTPAGWPTHHSTLTPPAPKPASLGTISQRASGETNHLRQPAHWKHSEQKRGARCCPTPKRLLGTPAHPPTKPEPL